MYLGIASNKSTYKELFEREESIEVAIMLSDITEDGKANVDVQALLIDGDLIAANQLSRIRESYPNIPIFFALPDVNTHEVTKMIHRLCTANRVIPIHEHYTQEQVVSSVLQEITEEDETKTNQVVAFFGTHSGVGVSTTVMNLAESVSQRVKDRVLVLSLNAWDPSDYFVDYKGKYLNDLKVDLKTKSLTTEKLHEALFQHNEFYHLAGNRDIKLQRFYSNDEVSHLIEVAKQSFDLILIDGGTHFDTALATQAYVSSNLRFIVTSQEDKGYRGYFPHVFQQLIEPSGGKRQDFMLVINRFQPNMSLISENDLEAELEINRIATIPEMDVLGAVAIRQKELLYNVSTDKRYPNSVDSISNVIINEANLKEHQPGLAAQTTNNKGLFGGIFRRKQLKKGG